MRVYRPDRRIDGSTDRRNENSALSSVYARIIRARIRVRVYYTEKRTIFDEHASHRYIQIHTSTRICAEHKRRYSLGTWKSHFYKKTKNYITYLHVDAPTFSIYPAPHSKNLSFKERAYNLWKPGTDLSSSFFSFIRR